MPRQIHPKYPQPSTVDLPQQACDTHSVFDAQFVTLEDAGVFDHGDCLWGFIRVRRNDHQYRVFHQRLPDRERPEPPGWAEIENITGVTATEVISSWDDFGRENAAAEHAFAQLRQRIGSIFYAHVGASNELHLDDLPTAVDRPAKDAPELTQAVPAERAQLYGVVPQVDPTGQAPPILQIIVKPDTVPPLNIPIPDKDFDAAPKEWWHIEVMTEVAVPRIASSWELNDNTGLRQNFLVPIVRDKLIEIFNVQRTVPLTPDGHIDLAGLRREVVRARFLAGRKPKMFVWRDLEQQAYCSWELLKDTMGERVFRFHAVRDAAGTPAIIRKVISKERLEILDTEVLMRGILARAIDFVATARGGMIKHPDPGQNLVRDMLALPDLSVPPIDALARIPTVRADGMIHDTPGYDPVSRIWYSPEMKIASIPDKPTAKDVAQARRAILRLFKEIPFVPEGGGLAGAIACLLEQIVRPMIKGPRPLYAFDAPSGGQGTGKTLLAKTIQAIITGERPGTKGFGRREEEIEKRIVSYLKQGYPFIILDNISRVVSSDALSIIATSETYSTRLLNTNDAPEFPQTATWCLTLNEGRFDADVARRVVLVKLDTYLEKPTARQNFEIPDLVTYALENRSEVIRACLILARSWVTSGRPGTKVHMSSFENWCKVIGGILDHAKIRGLQAAIAQARKRDVDAQEHEAFVAHWASTFAVGQKITPLQLATLAENHGLYAHVLENVPNPVWKARHMSRKVIKKIIGRTYAGFRITEHKNNRQSSFALEMGTPQQTDQSLN